MATCMIAKYIMTGQSGITVDNMFVMWAGCGALLLAYIVPINSQCVLPYIVHVVRVYYYIVHVVRVYHHILPIWSVCVTICHIAQTVYIARVHQSVLSTWSEQIPYIAMWSEQIPYIAMWS